MTNRRKQIRQQARADQADLSDSQTIDGVLYRVVIGKFLETIPGTNKTGRRFYTVPVAGQPAAADALPRPLARENKLFSDTSPKRAGAAGGLVLNLQYSAKETNKPTNKDSYKNNFEILSVANVICGKEARGLDASFERNLLKAWAKVPGWEFAGEVLL